MMGMLSQAGADLISRAEDADVIVVNTCSFIASAQQESVNTILEMARHKDRWPRPQTDRCRMPGRTLSR
jgi:ribosomal protein S12 methylthiotransferase